MATAEIIPAKKPGQAISKVKDLLQSDHFKKAVAAGLPKHCKIDRFMRVALNATMRTPLLMQCTPESLFRCLLDLSALGLEPDGRRAHLIPFRNTKAGTVECTLIVDYKGIAELVRNSGDVSYVHADLVYEKDDWSFAYGSKAHLNHIPCLSSDRGKPKLAYSFVRLKDGSEDFTIMSIPEIEAIRRRSRSADKGPWVTDWPEMAKKTVFRRHSKWLPWSADVKDKFDKVEEAEQSGMTVDFGAALEAATERGTMLEASAGTVDDLKASEEENRGHGNEGLERHPMPDYEDESQERVDPAVIGLVQSAAATVERASCPECHILNGHATTCSQYVQMPTGAELFPAQPAEVQHDTEPATRGRKR